ncbi:MAG: hypothetical protein EDX89_08515 [Acidobacteria bacterium]|nr:MAG: hypothetical protein EDX89_08515 [Acidobacteriota bacterium]
MLLDPVLRALRDPSPRRTPLVQSVLLMALADTPSGSLRRFVVVTDLRESELWNECDAPPSLRVVNRRLRATDCPTRLSGIRVIFAFCGLRPPTSPRCNQTVTAYENLRAFWRTFVASNGGTTEFYNDQPTLTD